MNDSGYSSPRAVENAIRDAARSAAKRDSSITTSDRIRQEYFRRFLSRVFSVPNESGWLLKGGTGMLARVASARATRDIDLFRRNESIEAALEDLKKMAAVDLGDFFRFEYAGHRSGIGGSPQTAIDGFAVRFDVYIGANKREALRVDLVTNANITDEATVAAPANALSLPKLKSNDFWIYPVVDQIADKVCATVSKYGGRESTRERDLVDIVILAVTESIEADKLWRALRTEFQARTTGLPAIFKVPESWGSSYAKIAKAVPACNEYRSVNEATAFVSEFLDPVFRREVIGMTWYATEKRWRV